MRKATITITAISILIAVLTCFLLNRSKNLVDDITALNSNDYTLHEGASTDIASAIEDLFNPEYNNYHYTVPDLNQNTYKQAAPCMLAYTEQVYNTKPECAEIIANAILKERGEQFFVEAIIGDALYYSKADNSVHPYFTNNPIANSYLLKDQLKWTFANQYRDPEKLEAFFNNNKDYFFSYITKTIYITVFEEKVKNFINAYNAIYSSDNSEAFYNDIYTKADNENNHAEYWEYTFWKRRELEGNHTLIRRILGEIDRFYNED
ncbi:MAG: hypothetical protein ACK5NB_12550 [Flavobacteriaceae bacterium]